MPILFNISNFMYNTFLYCVVYEYHYYYVDRALLQMVQLILNERNLDCCCEKQHSKKYASVLEAIRRADYMLCWVVSIFFLIYIHLIIFPEYTLVSMRITDMTTVHTFPTVAITYQTSLHVTFVPEAAQS